MGSVGYHNYYFIVCCDYHYHRPIQRESSGEYPDKEDELRLEKSKKMVRLFIGMLLLLLFTFDLSSSISSILSSSIKVVKIIYRTYLPCRPELWSTRMIDQCISIRVRERCIVLLVFTTVVIFWGHYLDFGRKSYCYAVSL